MLPFLRPKKMTSVIIARRKPEGSIEPMHEEDMEDPALMAVAEDLLSAIASKDATQLAQALKMAFELLDSEPHVEGPHIEGE